VKSKIAKSTLADANENRNWRICEEFAQILIIEARYLYKDDKDFSNEVEEIAYALDSITIDLCLSLFTWAKFRKKKGAVKIHTLMDLRGSIPTFIEITHAKLHDVNILDLLLIELGAIYVMDSAYLDFNSLYSIHKTLGLFITKDYMEIGETLDARRRNIVEEAYPITLDGKWICRYQGGGLGCSTDDRHAAKHIGREGPRLMSIPLIQSEARVR